MDEEKKIESLNDLKEMKLHESVFLEPGAQMYRAVTRVPGGWIYTFFNDGINNSCFVPEK